MNYTFEINLDSYILSAACTLVRTRNIRNERDVYDTMYIHIYIEVEKMVITHFLSFWNFKRKMNTYFKFKTKPKRSRRRRWQKKTENPWTFIWNMKKQTRYNHTRQKIKCIWINFGLVRYVLYFIFYWPVFCCCCYLNIQIKGARVKN